MKLNKNQLHNLNEELVYADIQLEEELRVFRNKVVGLKLVEANLRSQYEVNPSLSHEIHQIRETLQTQTNKNKILHSHERSYPWK